MIKQNKKTEMIDLSDLNSATKRLDFSHMNLTLRKFEGADLEFADFEGADLSYANFTMADLRFANLKNAKLEGTDFYGADLKYACFNGANISGVSFNSADLDYADLSDTVIRGSSMGEASMKFAYFRNARFYNVFLETADVYHANFSGACFENTDYPVSFAMACPSNGAFTAWRTGYYVKNKDTIGEVVAVVIELLIPKDARRLSTLRGMCRADKAIVKSIYSVYDNEYVDEAISEKSIWNGKSYHLTVDETITSEFDLNRFTGTSGIDFVIDKDVAWREAYNAQFNYFVIDPYRREEDIRQFKWRCKK